MQGETIISRSWVTKGRRFGFLRAAVLPALLQSDMNTFDILLALGVLLCWGFVFIAQYG
jgi:hypothetical protein